MQIREMSERIEETNLVAVCKTVKPEPREAEAHAAVPG